MTGFGGVDVEQGLDRRRQVRVLGDELDFQQLAADWRSTQQVVKTSLDEIAQALRAASQTYDEAEAASRAMMGGR